MRRSGVAARVHRAVATLGELQPTLYALLETYAEGVTRAQREWWLPHADLALATLWRPGASGAAWLVGPKC